MTIDIRRITQGELGAFLATMTTAFLERPDLGRITEEVRPIWDLERLWAAWDDRVLCGTFRSWATELTVPGGARLPAAAISGVSVLPTHRRRGILRGLAAAEHSASLERGEPISVLYASEYPIYGRFGYGPATLESTWTLDVAATGFRGDAPAGRVTLEQPSEATRDACRTVFDAWRLGRPGEIRRRDVSWDYDLGLRTSAWGEDPKGFVVVHRALDGAVDGYARYHAESRWEQRQPRNQLIVDELHGLDPAARAALWRFLASMDWVASVKAARRSPADPLPWLLDNARAAALSEVGDGLWVRLGDLPAALEARRYATHDRLVIEVAGDEPSGSHRRVELDGGPDGATCRPTTKDPDLTLPAAALGAAYLGGPRLRDVVLGSGFEAHTTGALTRADAMFRGDDPPWCSTFF